MQLPEHCDKGSEITSLQKGQASQDIKIDAILHNQKTMGSDMKAAINRLTAIIEADIGTRKDVEQLKKDREILFDQQREDVARIDAVMMRNARCDGIGVFDNFPTLWDWYREHNEMTKNSEEIVQTMKSRVDKIHTWYQGELGWRRFIPGAITIATGLLAIYMGLQKISHAGYTGP